jgi:predicted nuclease with TOPRIM domain
MGNLAKNKQLRGGTMSYDVANIISGLNKKVEKLTQERDKLVKDTEYLVAKNNICLDNSIRLEEENELLGKKVDEVRGWFADHVRTIRELREENETLRSDVERLSAENERLRNRIACLKAIFSNRFDAPLKLQAMGAVDVDALKTQIDELTKHNHALAERAKKAEVRHQIADSVNVTFCAGVLKSIHINGIPTSPDCVLTMTHVPKGLPELKCILKYETCYGEDQ